MNLKEVSVYAVYMLVVNGIKSVILSVSAGFQSTIGRAYASNDQEELKRIFKRYFIGRRKHKIIICFCLHRE